MHAFFSCSGKPRTFARGTVSIPELTCRDIGQREMGEIDIPDRPGMTRVLRLKEYSLSEKGELIAKAFF